MEFEKLYSAYYMQVYSYVMTLAKNGDLAEEITQNTFYKAVSTSAKCRNAAHELTWLCAIAKNLFYEEARKRQHLAELPPDSKNPQAENIEQAVINADSVYQIHLILHQLEEPYKEVFQLRVFGELAFRQIADIFGKTESWARVTYHRARLKIQERMDDHE